MSETNILDPMALWGVEMTTAEMWALIMSAHSMRKALTAQAKAEGMLRLAALVLVDGDGVERADVARQITELLGEVEA